MITNTLSGDGLLSTVDYTQPAKESTIEDQTEPPQKNDKMKIGVE